MRHAQSNAENPDWSDFERPLNSWGLKVAPFIGNLIYQNNLQPNLIISSPAKRAKQTAVLVKEVAEVKTQIEFAEKIYQASPISLLSVVSNFQDKYETVLLVGHNPGIEGFIKMLTGNNQFMSAGSIAQISLRIEKWNEIASDCGYLEMTLNPNVLLTNEAGEVSDHPSEVNGF